MKKTNILGVNVDKVTYEEAVEKIMKMLNEWGNHVVFTPNSEIILMAYKDEEFCDVLNSADLLTADGIGVVHASKIVGNPVPERVAGFDISCGVIDEIAKTGHRLFLFGGKPGVAETAAENLKAEYSLINIVGTRDGYFSPEENDMVVNEINSTSPDLVLVCLGAPKQEKWIFENREKLNCHVMMGVGGTVDVLAGTAERAPDIWCDLGFEWLYRLIKQPSRFFRMMALPKFALTVLFKGRKFSQGDEE